MDNFGIIIKRIRMAKNLTLKEASAILGVGVGWLSEVENSKGQARITKEKYEEILKKYDGKKYRLQFKKWIYESKYTGPKENNFIGPGLRHYRLKAKLKQTQVSKLTNLSPTFISRVEQGKEKVSEETLLKLLKIYNVGIAHFKQSTNPVDSKSKKIPIDLRIQFLILKMDEEKLEKTFKFIGTLV